MIHALLPYIPAGTIAEKLSGFRIIWKRIPKQDQVRNFPIPDPYRVPARIRQLRGKDREWSIIFSRARTGKNRVHVVIGWSRRDPARTLAAIAHVQRTTGNEMPGRV